MERCVLPFAANPLQSESDTHIDSNSLHAVAVLRWIRFGQVPVEFLIVLVPFNGVERFTGLEEFIILSFRRPPPVSGCPCSVSVTFCNLIGIQEIVLVVVGIATVLLRYPKVVHIGMGPQLLQQFVFAFEECRLALFLERRHTHPSQSQ